MNPLWYAPSVPRHDGPTPLESSAPGSSTDTVAHGTALQRFVLWAPPTPVFGINLWGGRRLQFSPIPALVRLFIFAMVLFAGWCAIRAPGLNAKITDEPSSAAVVFTTNAAAVDPGGWLFDTMFLVVLSTLLGGSAAMLLDVPALVGIVWVAFALASVRESNVTSFTRTLVGRVGLLVILLRAGLSIDARALRQDIPRLVLLGTVPLACEAGLHALTIGLQNTEESPDATWSALRGFMAAAIAPSVVVPGVLAARSRGWASPAGPANVMLGAVVLESALAVWAISYLVDVAIPREGRSATLALALGPVQLLGGLLAGAVSGGLIALAGAALLGERGSTASVPGTTARVGKRVGLTMTVTVLAVGLNFVFLGPKYNIAAGSAIAVVSLGGTLATIARWQQDDTRGASTELFTQVTINLAYLWDSYVMPALFTMLGSSVDASKAFSGAFLGRSLPGMAAGLIGRAGATVAISFVPQLCVDDSVNAGAAVTEGPPTAAPGPPPPELVTSISRADGDSTMLTTNEPIEPADMDSEQPSTGGEPVSTGTATVSDESATGALPAQHLPTLPLDDTANVTDLQDATAQPVMESGWTSSERLWLVASWFGKASVQAALGGAALLAAQESLTSNTPEAAPMHSNISNATTFTMASSSAAPAWDQLRDVHRAEDLQTLASLSALLLAPASAMVMRITAPFAKREGGPRFD